MKTFTHSIGSNIYTIRVGQTAKENWNLIDSSDPFDLWFHLDNHPSSHVVISQDLHVNSANHLPLVYPNQIITLAAEYCKSYSKQKLASKVKVVYAQVENLTKGKVIGSVCISEGKYVHV